MILIVFYEIWILLKSVKKIWFLEKFHLNSTKRSRQIEKKRMFEKTSQRGDELCLMTPKKGNNDKLVCHVVDKMKCK